MLSLRCLLFAAAFLSETHCEQAKPGEVGQSSSTLAKFVSNLLDQMNDVKQEKEMEAKMASMEVEVVQEEELPALKVQHEDGIGYCLLLSTEVSLEILGLNGDNKTVTVPVSATAEVVGKCLEGHSEVRFVWRDEHSEEDNLINLVVERHIDQSNLVYLSGAFLRLHHLNRRLEFYTSMGPLDYRTLLWPIRYQLNCPELKYKLAPIKEYIGRENISVVLHLDDIKIEAFRDVTLQNHRPESFGNKWYRREWKCEFHRIYDWAPYAVGCGLIAVVVSFVTAFLIRDSIERKKKKKTSGKYERL